MRQFRRGCFYQNKEPKYIWKVYDIDTQLSGGTIGSISIRSNRTKMASTEFTYSNGTFTLTNPTSKTITNLSVGDYIVDIRTNTAGANITSGSAIYKVTGKSGSSNITLSYTKYTSMKNIQGSTYYYDVASDTLDYPMDGEQDGYWYVMVKGEQEMHVWDVYEKALQYQEKMTNNSHFGPSSWPVRLLYSSSYSFDASTGKYTLINGTDKDFIENNFNMQLGAPNVLSGKYYQTYNVRYRSWNTDRMYYSATNLDYTDHTWYAEKLYSSESVIIRGAATGESVESWEETAYPMNGEHGSYWYVYSHSYMKKFDNR